MRVISPISLKMAWSSPGGPGEHVPRVRVRVPGATSDSGRIGHFAGAAYAFRDIIAKTRARAMGAEFATQFV